MINISTKNMHAYNIVNHDIILEMGFRQIGFS